MIKRIISKWLLAFVFLLSTYASPIGAALAQQQACLPLGEINRLVKSQQILSFNKITKIIDLKRGSKIFGQRLCEVNGRFVYFFKVVDTKGNALGVAVRAKDGKPFDGKG